MACAIAGNGLPHCSFQCCARLSIISVQQFSAAGNRELLALVAGLLFFLALAAILGACEATTAAFDQQLSNGRQPQQQFVTAEIGFAARAK